MDNTTTGQGLGKYIITAVFLALTFSGIALAQFQNPPPAFSKSFSPDTIGPGSTSTLTFAIDNTSGLAVTDLAFTDTLPAGVTLATPASAVTDCTAGVLTAPDGGSTISLTDGTLGAGGTCTVSVDVTSSTAGIYSNTSGDLTSSAGNSGTASDDLTVDDTLPGFSKSFAPGTVSLGGRSTLTLTVDNTANESSVLNLDFTDNLPTGMVIAAPANAVTDCGTATIPPTLNAGAGNSSITLDANGTGGFPALAAGATCSVTVDVTTTASGLLDNVTGELLADFVSAGKASATLEVTVTAIALQKSFTDDPVPPGGTVTLDFIIDNFDRVDSATGIAFSDDLDATLTGLTFASLLSNDCGGSVTGVGTTAVGLTGGTLPPEGSCTISASLAVPAFATPGAYTNTTGAISATIGGSPVTGNMATEDLFVEPVPLLTKLFVGDPVGAGEDVTLRFTVTNTSTTSGAADITFVDELTDGSGGLPPDLTSGFLPFPVSVTLPPVPDPPCGAGSSLALVSVGTDRQGLELTGGSLAAAPGAGATCTFEVTVTIPVGFPGGTYLNTTEEITATVDGATRIGNPASDDLVVVAAPRLLKEFIDDPVDPGDTVTLRFTLTHDATAPGDASGVTFTDDLAALVPAITGLAATGLPLMNVCGPGNGTLAGSAGDTLLTFSGATLTPGQVCTFDISLNVPGGATQGDHTNTTSPVAATVLGTPATANPASDDLRISGLTFTKEFVSDPVIAGDTLTLRFTIDNTVPTTDATITGFTDNLDGALTGLAATGAPSLDTCGGSLSGTTFLTYTGGSVSGGTTCTIEVEVLVPAGTADDDYLNITSSLSASQGGPISVDPAVDVLTVNSNLIALSKTFTDDPVVPGGDVTLEFTLQNLDAANAASAIAFSDDLDAVLTGLAATSLPAAGNACNGSGTLGGAGLLTFSGGSLAAGASCTFSATLSVPAAATPGSHTNQTSALSGTINDLPVVGGPASDDLVVNLVTLGKTFTAPATTPGTTTLEFTLTNTSTTDAVSDLSFTDNLDAVITGLVATNTPLSNDCGAGSLMSGTGLLTLTGGSLPPGGACNINVDLAVPSGATVGDHTNTTSSLTRFGLVMGSPASADLTVLGTVGGTVSGLAGSGLVLRNNMGDDLLIAGNGAFTFATPLASGSTYSVGVSTQPTGPSQTCSVSNGSGTMGSANVTSVVVSCATNTYTVGGTVSGLPVPVVVQSSTMSNDGKSKPNAPAPGILMVLQNNGGDDLNVTANGPFGFATQLMEGAAYNVTVLSVTQTMGTTSKLTGDGSGTEAIFNDNLSCVVTNGSGVMPAGDVLDISVDCATVFPSPMPIPTLDKVSLALLVLALLGILVRFRTRNRGVGI